MTTHAASDQLACFNALPDAEAETALHACCGSKRWVKVMLTARPFRSAEELHRTSELAWSALGREDWLEAFAHHPRIGERNLSAPKFAATAQLASREQSGMATATDDQRRAFVEGNAEYERRFGHVFLIRASGRTALEMLEQLRTRLGNDAATELANAAHEQSMITRLRLERMLGA